MRADKKTKFGKVRFVLSARLGKAKSYDGVTEKAAHLCLALWSAPDAAAPKDALGRMS